MVTNFSKPKLVLVISALIFLSLVFNLPGLNAADSETGNGGEPEIENVFEWMQEEAILDLEITTAGKKAEKIRHIPASVVVVTREEIQKYGYQTLEEILEHVPGMYMIENYDWTGVKNFGVRGFFSEGNCDNIAIMVNGIKQRSGTYNSVIIGKVGVPVQAIDRIEIIRGPMSVIYGSGAFFGAINIITNQKGSESRKSLVSAGYGTQNTYDGFTRVSAKEGDLDVVINAGLHGTDGIDESYSEMLTDTANPYTNPAGVENTEGQYEDKRKFANASLAYGDFVFNINHSRYTKGMTFGSVPVDGESELENVSTDISMGYTKKIADWVTVSGVLTYLSTRFEGNYSIVYPDFYGWSEIWSDEYEGELNVRFTPADQLDVMAGFSRNMYDAKNVADFPLFAGMGNVWVHPTDDIVTNAFFVQTDYRPFDQLTIVGGIRFEQMESYTMFEQHGDPSEDYHVATEYEYDRDDVHVIPRLAGIYSFTDNHAVKLLYGKAIKLPSFGQNVDMVLYPDKPRLEPAEIQTLELNYIGALSSKLNVNASVFRNELENLITRASAVNEAGDFARWAVNGGHIVTYGAELSVRANPVENFWIDVSGTYQDSEDQRDGYEDIEPGFSPQYLAYLKASYLFPHNILLSVTGRYVDEMESNWIVTGNQKPHEGKRVGEKADGYFTLDMHLLIKNLIRDGLFLNLKANNLLDEEVYYPTSENNACFDKGTLGMGMSFFANLGYEF